MFVESLKLIRVMWSTVFCLRLARFVANVLLVVLVGGYEAKADGLVGICTDLQKIDSHLIRIQASSMADVRLMYDAVKGLSQPKGKFESSDEYVQRMNLLVNRTRIGSKTLADTFMVMKPIDSYNFKYDADQRKIRIEKIFGLSHSIPVGLRRPSVSDAPQLSEYEDGFNEDAVAWEVRRISREGRGYVGSNAYGRQVGVEVSLVNEYNIMLMNLVSGYSCGDYNIELDALPSVARELENNLALVVSFVIRKPYSVETSFRVPPEINRPDDIRITQYNIVAKAHEIHLINRVTGRVLGSYRAAPLPDPSTYGWRYPERWRRLRLGMPQDSVLALLGQPQRKDDRTGFSTWYYSPDTWRGYVRFGMRGLSSWLDI